jgi:predicted nucleotidyltransferase
VDPVPALAGAVADEPDVDLAVLFGSAARSTARRNSDLDVAVLGPEAPERLAALAVSLSRRAGRHVDLIALDTASPLLRFEVARTGRLLLERRAHAWSDFKARAMLDWWDWAPHARLFAKAAAERLRRNSDHGAA